MSNVFKWYKSSLFMNNVSKKRCNNSSKQAIVREGWGLRVIFMMLFFTLFANAAITGTVFRDYNVNGTKDAAEPGAEGIIVKAYANNGNGDTMVGTATTAADGTYSLTASQYPVRLEFTIPSAGGATCKPTSNLDFSAYNGNTYGTGVQFAKDGEVHNYAINYPYDYTSNSDPVMKAVVRVNGDPLAGGTAANQPVLGVSTYLSNTEDPGTEGNSSLVGSTNGLALSRSGDVYQSALLQRHRGMGPSGSGAIYKNGSLFFDFDAHGIATRGSGTYVSDDNDNVVAFNPVIGTNAERGLNKDVVSQSHDSTAFAQVGRVSLGDIDLSEDDKFLYAVNLYDSTLYKISTNNPTTAIGYPVPTGTCTTGRAFGLKIYRGKAYVGVVCEEKLQAYVMSLDLSNGTWETEVDWVPERVDKVLNGIHGLMEILFMQIRLIQVV